MKCSKLSAQLRFQHVVSLEGPGGDDGGEDSRVTSGFWVAEGIVKRLIKTGDTRKEQVGRQAVCFTHDILNLSQNLR